MAKGGSYELEISKKLSLWFTNGERDDLVCRTDTSGGRATVRTKQKKITNKYLYGDLKHSDDKCLPMFDKWSIECKTGYKVGANTRWDLLDLIDSQQKEPMIVAFWNQCLMDAALSNREPILIFRRNGRGSCIVIRIKYLWDIEGLFGDWVSGSAISFGMSSSSCTTGLCCMNLDKFLEWADPVALFNS